MGKFILNILICFISILLFLFSPNFYSHEYCFMLFLFYLIFNACYLLQDSKNRSFSFEFLFMVSFLMTNFIYPVFYFLDNPTVSLFSFSFNVNIISKSTSLALLGYSFYILGNSNYNEKNKIVFKEIEINDQVVGVVFLSSIFFFCLFLISGGLEAYKDVYSGVYNSGGFSIYYMLFLSVTTYLLSILIFNNKNILLKNVSFIYIISLIIVFLSTGARLFAMSLVLLLLIQFSKYIKKISILMITLLLLVGAFFMRVIQVYREAGVENSNFGEIFLEMLNGKSSIFDSFLDLIINNRNLYVLTDFVDSNGHFYFLNISASIFGILPGIKGIMGFFNIPDYMTSGTFPTFLEFGNNATFGLGTNMVGEAYLSFGVIGVVLVFYFFGRLINYFHNKSNDSVYFRIAFFFLASQAVFFPRIDYLWGTRLVVWMIVMLFLVNFLMNSLKRNKA